MPMPEILAVPDSAAASTSSDWDAVVVVSPMLSCPELPEVHRAISRAAATDAAVGEMVVCLPAEGVAGGRVIVAPTGPLDRDYDDVRRYGDAARKALARAARAGSRRPLLLLPNLPKHPAFAHATEVALLGALDSTWQPLEARETLGERPTEPMDRIGIALGDAAAADVPHRITAIEAGRRLTRDIAGTEPERMRPEAMAEYCRQAFEGTRIQVHVLDDLEVIRREYPLLSAVARASEAVPRHRPRVIRLTYVADGPIDETLLIAGKGVTYDTGGADLKTDGHMAGMSRDKGGAAAAIGLMRVFAETTPPGLRVVAEIGAVRNSVGSDSFVADEIIRGHSGRRVRIGNTDAEGRLVLADLLSHLRVEAKDSPRPRILSIATLTGHAHVAVGPYSIAMDNGPASRDEIARSITRLGELWGQPFEVSRVRREDFDFVAPRSLADDTLSCNNAPSSRTPRGHQFPAAFLTIASGLDDHGRDSQSTPIPFTHIDIGGSACDGGDWQHGRPTAAPVTALAARWAWRGATSDTASEDSMA